MRPRSSTHENFLLQPDAWERAVQRLPADYASSMAGDVPPWLAMPDLRQRVCAVATGLPGRTPSGCLIHLEVREFSAVTRPDYCDCGSTDIHQTNTRMIGHARRRQFHCKTCGVYSSTLELRVPKGLDAGVFQAKLRSLLKKEPKHGKEKAAQDEKADEGKIQAIAQQEAGGEAENDLARQDTSAEPYG